MPSRSQTHALHPVLRKFGTAVRKLRQAQGMSQEAFALASGIDRSYFGAIERGENSVALLNLVKIADALGMSVAELMASAKL